MLGWLGLATVGVSAVLLAAQRLIAAQERLAPEEVAGDGVYTCVEGIDLYSERWGSGPPIVLLHGFASSICPTKSRQR